MKLSDTANPNEVPAVNVSIKAKVSERTSHSKRPGAKKTAPVSAKATKASPDRAKSDSKQDKIVAPDHRQICLGLGKSRSRKTQSGCAIRSASNSGL